jgi:hypothetical protein
VPVASRVKKKDCILFDFYDNHDVWHFMWALNLFKSFSIFFNLDDGLPCDQLVQTYRKPDAATQYAATQCYRMLQINLYKHGLLKSTCTNTRYILFESIVETKTKQYADI